MKIELTRYKVKDGKTDKVEEWLNFLNEHMKDVLITLENEKMFVETIFKETLDGVEYLYWYSIEGENGQDVSDSEHWIDKKHIEYWEECIDMTAAPVDIDARVVMISERIRNVMK
ncbi:DUF6176 family protein [Staphylococcus sp. IVB6246]|uniref:DUF6176 family protein n=1 Tax=Staphylococcus sp. IVB6246 TaxID=2989772 RepID=UPI0021D1D52C|nr:DUF6176 family protein [Staphylococcus sp. IVB6246]UXR70450.1 DUF6176 family protein [Staphylococcus sp. IVB6246]